MKPSLLALFLIAASLSSLSAQVVGDTVEKKAAVDAMTPWLQELDKGEYDQTWDEASKRFQQAATKEQWQAVISNLRGPLGACSNRTLDSALLQNGPEQPTPSGTALDQSQNAQPAPPPTVASQISTEYVIAQFNTSFENLKFALETVTFVKTPDGTWRASNYTVKPKTSDAP